MSRCCATCAGSCGGAAGLLVTTLCLGPGAAVDILNLWGAMTAGCGRLPTVDELTEQLAQAGFSPVTRRSLIPGDSFYGFAGTVGRISASMPA